MNPRAALIDAEGEVRELRAADMRKFKPACEVLPLELQKTLGVSSPSPFGIALKCWPHSRPRAQDGKRAWMLLSKTGSKRTRQRRRRPALGG